MSKPRTLQEAMYLTIHRSKKSIETIADEMGKSANLLYKWASNEESTSHADLPLRHLLTLLNSTENDAILDYYEYKRGRIAFRLPKKIAMSKLEESEMADEYAKTTLSAVQALRKFISNPTQDNYLDLDEWLRQVMTESISINKFCKKKSSGQMEMEL